MGSGYATIGRRDEPATPTDREIRALSAARGDDQLAQRPMTADLAQGAEVAVAFRAMQLSCTRRFASVGLGALAISFITHIPGADAQTASKPIVIDDLPSRSASALPMGVLRAVARDYAAHGDAVACPNLRDCDDLNLSGVAVDLDGDGVNEWIVQDVGFSGTGAERDYVFKRGTDRRWAMIGRIDGLHLQTIGPTKTKGFLALRGGVAGRCVEGRGTAIWDGRRYVAREGRVRSRPC